MNRFVDIDLSRLPAPDAIEALDSATILDERTSDLEARLDAKGISWDVSVLEPDPAVINQQHASYYEVNMRARVNDAVNATLLAKAQKSDLDHIAADLGVQRLVLVEADPDANPPVSEVLEDDESLRRRRQLAIEAFSTAGPEGAYTFFALSAHPHVSNVAIYDPHSGLANPGEVLCVIASNQGDGVPTDQVLDSVAEALDARLINYAVTEQRTRAITRRQKLRPLTDLVIVEACTVLDYTVSAVLKIPFGPDAEVVRMEAEARVWNYLNSRKTIERIISDSAVAAAVHVADEHGVALVDDADIIIEVAGAPVTDVVPGPKQLARATSVIITYEVLT